MLGEIFYWIVNMSISASVTGLAVMLIRCVKRVPRRVIRVLWLIPALRMLIPLGIGSKYGLMTLISRFTTRTVTVFDGDYLDFTMMNSVMAANSYFPITYKVNILADVFRVGALVWLTVAVAIIITLIVLYRITMKSLHPTGKLETDVFLSSVIDTPALYGIIKPKIYLPTSYEGKDNEFVLLHERTHAKRGDNFFRMAAFAVAALHWFNPLSWVFLRSFLADTELACDEAVLSKCGEKKKKAYALALIDCAESKTIFASAFGGAKIRVRIENILSYKKLSLLSACGFALLVIATAYVLLTNAV